MPIADDVASLLLLDNTNGLVNSYGGLKKFLVIRIGFNAILIIKQKRKVLVYEGIYGKDNLA